jgi:hypothetical protein
VSSDEPEGLAWVDYDYTPAPRKYEQCEICQADRTFQHHCDLLEEIRRLKAHLAAVPSAIQAYAGGELDGYSYHGDGPGQVEAVAEAIWQADGSPSLATFEPYIRRAQAAVEALQLTEESVPTAPPRGGDGIPVRLVGPWRTAQ